MDILKSLVHPEEVLALVRFKLGGGAHMRSKIDQKSISDSAQMCYELLNLTSRSFSAVIQALEGDLRHAVCIFYLVLRALDTVEDDMTISLEKKIPMLKSFHSNLHNPTWNFTDSQEKDRMVLVEFPAISAEFRGLDPIYQEVIEDICKQMGHGMTVYLERHPDTLEDWDLYCHYVAGLVGIGLSRLFAASGLEDQVVGEDTKLANSMGLFLQKTNIIRDYLEDVQQGRLFWPRAVWSKYAPDLADLSRPEKCEDALACLNELITDALRHVPDCLKYMSRLHNQSIFNFCAIPQVMAIATLERCYNNYKVFCGVVKIRKGEAVHMMQRATCLATVKSIMRDFSLQIEKRIPDADPSAARTQAAISQSLSASTPEGATSARTRFLPIYVSFAMLTTAILWQYWTTFDNIIYNSYAGNED